MELSSIDHLPPESFRREFGGIPEGEPTLFAVEETETGISRLILPSVPGLDIVQTTGESILHLSDLHFGGDYGFTTTQRDDPISEPPLESIITDRIRILKDCQIGVVVISGDIITKGDANAFPSAKVFLESLLKSLKLGKEHVVIVPGNHDIWLQDVEHPTREYLPKDPFLSFKRDFYGADISEIECLHAFRTPGGWILSFLGLNSARPRSKETMDYGYVGQDRYARLLSRISEINEGRSLNELSSQKRLNFAVLHHHLIPAALVCKPEMKRPVSLTLDAGQLVADFQASVIHFALHGHQHIPFVGSTARAVTAQNKWTGYEKPLFVIGSGSSGVTRHRLWDEKRNNTFGIYTPQPNGFRVRVEEYNQALKPWTFMDLVIPF